MATFRVQAPDGVTYRIEGPADASDDEVVAFAAAEFDAGRMAAPKPGPLFRGGPRRPLIDGARIERAPGADYAGLMFRDEMPMAAFDGSTAKAAARLPGNIKESIGAQATGMIAGVGDFANEAAGILRAKSAVARGGTEQTRLEAAASQNFDRSQHFRGIAREAEIGAAEAVPQDAGIIERAIQAGVSSAALAAPAVIAGGPVGGATLLGGGTAGQRYSSLRSQGIAPGEAAESGLALGALEGLTEFLPGKALVKNATGFWKRVTEFAAAELPGENIASVAQMVDDYRQGLRDDITAEEVLATLRDTSLAAAFGGAAQVGAVHALQAGAGAGASARRARDVEVDAKAKWDGFGRLVTASPARGGIVAQQMPAGSAYPVALAESNDLLAQVETAAAPQRELTAPESVAQTQTQRPPASTSASASADLGNAADTDGIVAIPAVQEREREEAARSRGYVDGESPTASRVRAQLAVDAYDSKNGHTERTVVLGPPTAEDADAELQINALSDALGSAWGGRIVAFRDSRPEAPNGVEIQGRAFINLSDPEHNVTHVVFHENYHAIETIARLDRRSGNHDSAANKFVSSMETLFDDMSDAGKRFYITKFIHADLFAELAERGGTEEDHEDLVQILLDRQEAKSEMIADFFGNRGRDREWLRGLAEADPQGFKGFVDKWLQMLDNLIDTLKGSLSGKDNFSEAIDGYLSNLEQAKAVARDALVEYARSRRGDHGAGS